jgi:hypothetical protein
MAMDIVYKLIVQTRREVGVVAEFNGNTPFPYLDKGDSLELTGCRVATWDVYGRHTRIGYDERGNLMCVTILLVSSPVLDQELDQGKICPL